MVMAIEQVINLWETTEELCGRLLIAEEGYNLDDATDSVNKLLLIKEEWQFVSDNVGRARPAWRQQQQAGVQAKAAGCARRWL
jgi:hypothetical protein